MAVERRVSKPLGEEHEPAASTPPYERLRLRRLERWPTRVVVLATVVVDAVAVVGALTLGTAIRFGSETIEQAGPYGRLLVIWLPLWLGALAAMGLYRTRRLRNPAEELRRSVHGVTLGAALTVLASFWAHFQLSRGWILISWLGALIAVPLGRRAVRKTVHALRRRGRLRRRTLIVGTDHSARALAETVRRAPWEGLDVVGFVSLDGGKPGDSALDGLVVGSIDRLPQLVTVLRVTDVLVAPAAAASSHVAELIASLDGVPVDLSLAPGLEGFLPSRLTVQPLGDRPLVALERPELRPAARGLKRALDLVLGTVLLLIAAPLLAACAAAIRLDTPGPVFFRQRRIGLGGRPFTIWKLRTMVADAEQRRGSLVALNESEGLLFKIRDDPRVTRVGRFLRRMSLDELPQLLNVLAGHMSLVGPRPPLPEEVERYDARLGRRLIVKPGMTGLWQVSGRQEASFDDYVRYDLLYVQNWSIALDLYILARTLPVVLRRRGAY